MRKDVKTGMLIGTVLCLVGVVWFCTKQKIASPAAPISATTQDEPFRTIVSVEPVNKQLPKLNLPAEQPRQKTIQSPITHIVRQGQTLSDISKIYYNSTGYWREIYEANKKQFPKGPDSIKPGRKLIIPKKAKL